MTIKKNKKIQFIKPVLNKLKWTGKREWYSALNQEALCIQVNKNSKAYYANTHLFKNFIENFTAEDYFCLSFTEAKNIATNKLKINHSYLEQKVDIVEI